jgi:hypothetical protein
MAIAAAAIATSTIAAVPLTRSVTAPSENGDGSSGLCQCHPNSTDRTHSLGSAVYRPAPQLAAVVVSRQITLAATLV